MKLALLIFSLFSGNWKMDPGRSNFGPAPRLSSLIRKVELAGPILTVMDEQTGGPERRQTIIRNYGIDGRQTTNTWMGADLKTTTAWNGTMLMMSSAAEGVRLTEKWSLAGEGRELIDEIHVVAPQGEYDMTYILDKQ